MDPPTPDDPADELVDVVDLEDHVVGRERRSEVRARNLLHRATAVLLTDPAGRIYAHRRTETKDVYPGMYDCFAGGVVAAGESYDESAERELAEELGVEGVPLEPLFRHLFESEIDRHFVAVYRAVHDGPVRHQPEEVAWGAWRPLDEVLDLLHREPFVPDGAELLRRMLDEGYLTRG